MASVDMHDIDLKEFNEVLAACKGDVFMVTPEGDRLNLKSRLCQLIGFTKLIEGGSIAEVEIGNIRRGGRHKKSGGQRGQRRAAENGLPADKVQNAGGREMHGVRFLS